MKVVSCLLVVLFCCHGVGFAQRAEKSDRPFLVVLGIAQDGGVPQAGTKSHPGWSDPAARQKVVCLGLVDPVSGERWLFEATPDFPEQLHQLDALFPVAERPGLRGIFMTHAHIGHYTGLMFLGHEVMGAQHVPVFVMPRMREFLSANGPWDQLVRFGNIDLHSLRANREVKLNDRLAVTPFLVPHRQEYSEVVGFKIRGPRKTVLFIPDIDSWEQWDEQGQHIEDVLRAVDVAFVDGTFFANGEIRGRDMTGFPHPFITHSMQRFAKLPLAERRKLRFIHFNHTNPVLHLDSPERRMVEARGFRLAIEGERLEL